MYKTNISTKKYRAKSRPFSLGVAGIMGLAGLGVAMSSASVLASGSSEVGIDVNVGTVLSLAVYPTGDHTGEQASQVSLNAMPGGPLATNAVDVVVNTNVKSGYQLTLRDSDDENGLKNAEDGSVIPTLDHEYETNYFPTGYYGYNVDDGDPFIGVPKLSAEPAILKQTSSLDPGVGETTKVTFGVKVGNSNPGDYTTSVIFTASPELVPEAPAGMSEWTEGLYWDNKDLDGEYNWEDAKAVCASKGKRLPGVAEYNSLLTTQNITNDEVGAKKIANAPYNFSKSIIDNGEGSAWYSTSDLEVDESGSPTGVIGSLNIVYMPDILPSPQFSVTAGFYGSLASDLMSVRCVKDKE